MRRIRCLNCGAAFYTATDIRECQDCTGTHDDTALQDRDAEAIRLANKTHRSDKPQSIDPRGTSVPAATPNETPKKGRKSS